jgi:hypothetical protein
MKKLVLIGAFVCTAAISANAQFTFGAGVNLALPIGDFSDTHSFGIGIEGEGEYMFSDMFSGVFNTGYTHFLGKEETIMGVTVDYESAGIIPVMAGVRVYPSSQFFIGGRAGVGFLTGGNDTQTGFVYRPEIGGAFGNVRVAASFNGFSKDGNSLNHIGLTVIFKFGAPAE